MFVKELKTPAAQQRIRSCFITSILYFPILVTFDQQTGDDLGTFWRTYYWTWCSLHSTDTADTTLLLNFPVCCGRQPCTWVHSLIHTQTVIQLYFLVYNSHIRQCWEENCFSHTKATFSCPFCPAGTLEMIILEFILVSLLEVWCFWKCRSSLSTVVFSDFYFCGSWLFVTPPAADAQNCASFKVKHSSGPPLSPLCNHLPELPSSFPQRTT